MDRTHAAARTNQPGYSAASIKRYKPHIVTKPVVPRALCRCGVVALCQALTPLPLCPSAPVPHSICVKQPSTSSLCKNGDLQVEATALGLSLGNLLAASALTHAAPPRPQPPPAPQPLAAAADPTPLSPSDQPPSTVLSHWWSLPGSVALLTNPNPGSIPTGHPALGPGPGPAASKGKGVAGAKPAMATTRVQVRLNPWLRQMSLTFPTPGKALGASGGATKLVVRFECFRGRAFVFTPKAEAGSGKAEGASGKAGEEEATKGRAGGQGGGAALQGVSVDAADAESAVPGNHTADSQGDGPASGSNAEGDGGRNSRDGSASSSGEEGKAANSTAGTPQPNDPGLVWLALPLKYPPEVWEQLPPSLLDREARHQAQMDQRHGPRPRPRPVPLGPGAVGGDGGDGDAECAVQMCDGLRDRPMSTWPAGARDIDRLGWARVGDFSGSTGAVGACTTYVLVLR